MCRFMPLIVSWHYSARMIAAIFSLAAISVANAWEDTPRLNIFHLAYPVAWNGRTVMIGARLQLPDGIKAKMPAVIILHGTGGIRYSGVYYAAALNRAGIATLEVDQWGGRGLTGAASNRPKSRGDMLPDVGGAYRLLAERPDIDDQRIGLMGYSMGGGETLLMMTRHYSEAILGPNAQIKAAVALYPVCWLYNHVPDAELSDLVDAPIRIMIGSADDYDGGSEACEGLKQELAPKDAAHISVRVFAGATHIFDSFSGSYEFDDPGANRRKGGVVHVRPDPEARQEARDDLTQFFSTALKP
jgi:dienelactone hydrolase